MTDRLLKADKLFMWNFFLELTIIMQLIIILENQNSA